jgi:DNA-binding HxlR family transcriptional regulator
MPDQPVHPDSAARPFGDEQTHHPVDAAERVVERRVDRDSAPRAGVLPEPPVRQGHAETWAVERAMAVLRGRWKAPILWTLEAGPHRYNALAGVLRGVTPKVLTEQLRELTRDGLVARHVQSSGPKHVEYALTSAGRDLLPALQALDIWGRNWARAGVRR